ncbi:PASTA domain-containing protein [Streptococcus caballi]|uniref:PASTA domain-containing protein n=1 Tax=Streptococcus caballi TaxID=439220 RepID=UPI000368AE63|nr:PASTA domain-containing protein [Streptococcus caballi]
MSQKTKWAKALGTVGKVMAVLPDTTEIIGRAIDNTRPIIEKELDRRNDLKKHYIDLDNVIHLDITDAKQHLEKQGFIVRAITENPHPKYANTPVNQVVNMYPRSKKARSGALIKLYYVDDTVLNASSILINEQEHRKEELGQKVVESLTGVKDLFDKKKKSRKDVTPK